LARLCCCAGLSPLSSTCFFPPWSSLSSKPIFSFLAGGGAAALSLLLAFGSEASLFGRGRSLRGRPAPCRHKIITKFTSTGSVKLCPKGIAFSSWSVGFMPTS
jgi:hypothetical protein